MDEFTTFGTAHLVMLALFLVATIWALMTLPWQAARIQRARATVGAC